MLSEERTRTKRRMRSPRLESSRGFLRLKEPVPRRRKRRQVGNTAYLVPRQRHLSQPHTAEIRAAQAIRHFERLPEMLHQSAIAKLAEREVEQLVFRVDGGILPSGGSRHTYFSRPVERQHRHVVNAVHSRHN